MANSIRLGGARVDISGQDASFQRVMRRAGRTMAAQEKQLKKLRQQARLTNKAFSQLRGTVAGLAAGLAGGLGVAGLVTAAKEAADFSTKLVEGARNTGLLATELEAVAAIFEQDGIGFGATTTALATFQKRIAEVGDGLATYTRSFDKLGLSLEDLKGKTPLQQFITLAEALARVEDQSVRQQAAQDLLGRAGKQLVGTILQLAGSWDHAVRSADAATKTTNEQYGELKNLTGAFVELEREIQDMNARVLVDHTEEVVAIANAWNDVKEVVLEVIGAFAKLATSPQVDPVEALLFELRGFEQTRKSLAAQIASGPSIARQWIENVTGTEGDWTKAKTENLARLDDIIASMKMRLANIQASQEAAAWGGLPILGGGTAPARPQPAPDLGPIQDMGRLDRQLWAHQAEGGDVLAKAQIDAQQEAYHNLALAADQARLASIEAARASDAAWQSTARTFTDSFATAFGDFLARTRTASDAIKGFASSVIAQLIRIQAAQAATGLLGLFGGGVSNAPISAPGGGPPRPPGLSMGGTIRTGGLVDVHAGERIFLPPNATVFPRAQAAGAGGMGGGVTLNLTMNVHSTDGPGVIAAGRAVAAQVRAEVVPELLQTLHQPGLGRRYAIGR